MPGRDHGAGGAWPGWALLAIVVVALNLRTGLAVVPPLLDDVRSANGLSLSAAGLLTSLPVLCFGLAAPLAGWLGSRRPLDAVLAAAMAALAAGLVCRSYGGVVGLFVGSAVIGVAITLGNVLVPGLVKRDFPGSANRVTAVYVAALTGGAALAAGVSVALASTPLGWQGALSIWAVPALVAMALMVARMRDVRRTRLASAAAARPVIGATGPRPRVWRSAVAWQVTGYTGLQSTLFYSVLTWMPTILAAQGVPAHDAAVALVLFNVLGVPASLLAPVLSRGMDQRALLTAPCILWIIGILGLHSSAEHWMVWAVFLGIGQGAGLSLGLSQLVLRAQAPVVAAQLSAMSQFLGYGVAALGTWAVGFAGEETGGWTVPIAGLAVLACVMLASGLAAGRPHAVVGVSP